MMKCVLPILIVSLTSLNDMATGEPFKTESGANLKVIVRQPTAIYKTPSRDEKESRPASMFEFFYAVKPDIGENRTTNGFYRVATGASNRNIVGWIPAEDLVEWSHRQVLGMRPLSNRQRARFYKDRTDLETAFASTGQSPSPLSLEPKGGGGLNLIPIMDRFRMKVDGEEAFGYRVAYLHANRGNVGNVDLKKTSVDIVFVIDTTSSMGPYIDATRKAVAQLANELADDTPVRFGLVAYRDIIKHDDASWYHRQLICDLDEGKDHYVFQKRLSTIAPAELDSEEASEDVLAGLEMAIKNSKWNPDAFKHIILVGDASAHTSNTGYKNPYRLTIEGVVSQAQPRGAAAVQQKVALHAVRVVSDHPDDHALTEKQFKRIAQGDEVRGQYHVFNGDGETPLFVNKLVNLIRSSQESVARVRIGKAPKKDTPALGLLMEIVNAGRAESGGAIPQFASGFVSELDLEGNQLFEPYVLVQYGTTDLFDSALDFTIKSIRRAGQPDSRDVQRVVRQLQNFVAEINLGEELSNLPLSEFLRLVSGIPVRSRVFGFTIADLVAMPDADFERWVREIEASKARIRSHLDNTKIWFSLGNTDTPLAQRHAFLKVKDLP